MNPLRHLTAQDRLQHTLITGLPRTGRTIFFIEQILEDLKIGRQCIILDPYGDICDHVLAKAQPDSYVYIDAGNSDYPVGINIFEGVTNDTRRDVIQTMITLLYDLYDPGRTGIIGPRFDHAVRNAMQTVMYDPEATLLDIVRCLTDASYVESLLPSVTDPLVKSYWTKQMAQTSDFHKSEVLDYIVSKFGKIIGDTKIRNIVGQRHSTINVAQYLSEKKTLLIDMSGFLDDSEGFHIVSTLLFSKLFEVLRASCRLINEPVAFYIDEASCWPQMPLMYLLRDGARKSIALTISTQRISQIPVGLREEVLRVGTLVAFRAATADAQLLAPEFHAHVTVDDLCLLARYHVYIRLLSQGSPTRAERYNIERTIVQSESSSLEEIKNRFRQQYGRLRADVEAEIMKKLETY
jgi:hypothetical protein